VRSMDIAGPPRTVTADRGDGDRERRPLSRERIQASALRIVADEGLPALTMRRLAEDLEVWPTALYHHVADKGALIQLVLDGALAELEVPDDQVPWQDWYRSWAHNLRAVLLTYPGLAAHLEEYGNPSREAWTVTDRAVSILLRDGFDPEDAAVLYTNAFTLVIAHAQRESRLIQRKAQPRGRGSVELTEQMRQHVDDLPALRVAAAVWERIPPDAHLTSGIELLLAGAEQRRVPPGP
jgi:AcrR family transcriptional regulator